MQYLSLNTGFVLHDLAMLTAWKVLQNKGLVLPNADISVRYFRDLMDKEEWSKLGYADLEEDKVKSSE